MTRPKQNNLQETDADHTKNKSSGGTSFPDVRYSRTNHMGKMAATPGYEYQSA